MSSSTAPSTATTATPSSTAPSTTTESLPQARLFNELSWPPELWNFELKPLVPLFLSSATYREVMELPKPEERGRKWDRFMCKDQEEFADTVLEWARVLHKRIPPLQFSSMRIVETSVLDLDLFGRFVDALAYTPITQLSLHCRDVWRDTLRCDEIGPIIGRLRNLKVFRLKCAEYLSTGGPDIILDGVWASPQWVPFLTSLPPVRVFGLSTSLPIYPPDKVAARIMEIKPSFAGLDMGEADYRWEQYDPEVRRDPEATLRRPDNRVVVELEWDFVRTVQQHLPSVRTMFMRYGWDEDLHGPEESFRVFWIDSDGHWVRAAEEDGFEDHDQVPYDRDPYKDFTEFWNDEEHLY
ncbi:hypothetical protein BDN72DRAFT_966448 [Pluteus cervinus]|uniref:Uncharacterized protein n=1 Tax=Pluteus cervinus TaxID=181527 RepID=A0ACD2ZX70_9AGAR|nr:hypothetical protein BDN72DRAFT_966448 [Pluteus cervinus]